MLNLTTTYTTISRFALDNDALRRVVAVAIRRTRRVRRGYKKEQRSCDKFVALLFTARCYHCLFFNYRDDDDYALRAFTPPV
jgi:hypothetical protein